MKSFLMQWRVQKLIRLLIIPAFLCAAFSTEAQVVVDKTVAVVSDGIQSELITLSDIKWQLALQKGKELNPPVQRDFDEALRTLIDQRIFALEAKRLPRNPPTQNEIREEIARILRNFSSTAEFESRLRSVGFASIDDSKLEEIISDRLAIENYVDFRFRSFVVVTPDQEKAYFDDVYLSEFRRNNPGRTIPKFEDVRSEINNRLTEETILANIETFLDDAKRRVDVTIIFPN